MARSRRERVIEKPLRVNREHPRHERLAVRPSVDKVLKALAKIRGEGGRFNDGEARERECGEESRHVFDKGVMRSEAT